MSETESPNKHPIRNILIIIIIGLLIWQYIIPQIDSSIKIPSEYFNETFYPEMPSNLTFSCIITDKVNGVKTEIPIYKPLSEYESYDYRLTEFHSYSFELKCSLAGRLFGEYRWVLEIGIKNMTSGLIETTPLTIVIPAYTCYFTDTWTIPANNLYINYEKNYIITSSLYTTDGNMIKAKTYVPNLIVYSQTCFLLESL